MDNFEFLQKNFSLLEILFKNYHYELLLCDETLFFRKEMYPILEQHIHILQTSFSSFMHTQKSLFSFPLFSIQHKQTTIPLGVKMCIFDEKYDIQDGVNAFSLRISTPSEDIYNVSFYLSNETLLLTNIQFLKGKNDFLIIMRYSKILMYLVLKIAEKMKIKKIISFSNQNHPCVHHTINDGFKGDYDNICNNIGMQKNENGYFEGEI